MIRRSSRLPYIRGPRKAKGLGGWKLLSLLLLYPEDELLSAIDELDSAVGLLPRGFERGRLERFLEHMRSTPPGRLRQEYVETFDLQRRCSLYLSYFVDGDTRKRGQSLLRLKRLYAAAGWLLEPGELPDYLPAMLEFAALAPDGKGAQVLAGMRVPMELLRRSLRDRESPYADLIDAVCRRLPRLNPLQSADLGRLAAEGPPAEQVGLEPFAPPEVMPAEARR